MNSLLVNERPLHILPSLARLFNVEGAIVLQQTHWVTSVKTANKDQWTFWEGEWWCSYSQSDWHSKILPWVKSLTTVSKVFADLVKQGVLICAKPFAHNIVDKKNRNQVRWYRVNYEILGKKLGEDSDIAMTQFLYDRNHSTESAQDKEPSNSSDDTETVSSGENPPDFLPLVSTDLESALDKDLGDSSDHTETVSSSIYKNINTNTDKECVGVREANSDFEGPENLDLPPENQADAKKKISLAPPKKADGSPFNPKVLPGNKKVPPAPPENLTKADYFAWWCEHLDDQVFLTPMVDQWMRDYTFLTNLGAWLFKQEKFWQERGYKPFSAARAVVSGSLNGEKFEKHRSRLAEYFCETYQSPTPATTPQPVAPSAPAAPVNQYATMTDAEVIDVFVNRYQTWQASPPAIARNQMKIVENSYRIEFQRRYGADWVGAPLSELAQTRQAVA